MILIANIEHPQSLCFCVWYNEKYCFIYFFR